MIGSGRATASKAFCERRERRKRTERFAQSVTNDSFSAFSGDVDDRFIAEEEGFASRLDAKRAAVDFVEKWDLANAPKAALPSSAFGEWKPDGDDRFWLMPDGKDVDSYLDALAYVGATWDGAGFEWQIYDPSNQEASVGKAVDVASQRVAMAEAEAALVAFTSKPKREPDWKAVVEKLQSEIERRTVISDAPDSLSGPLVFAERASELAAARADARASLTPAGQIERLDRTLGVGIGAAKERAALAKPAKGKR